MMGLYSLPIGDSFDDKYRVEIGDKTYDFRLRWNTFDEAWTCYIGLTGEDPVVKFKVVGGTDLIEPYRGINNVPDALMFTYDETKTAGRVDLDIGQLSRNRFKLFLYFTE